MKISTFNTRFGTISIALCILLLFGSVLNLKAQQVKSDYQIQKEFKQEVTSIDQSLDKAEKVAVADQLIEQIKTLQETYRKHETLLNKALYPQTFEQRLEDLKHRAVTTRHRLATIEQQNKKLNELADRLSDYDNRLINLNERTDSLRTAVRKSIQSEKQISSRLRNYRKSLEERDQLILSIIDSVMIAYKDLNIESMSDLENARQKSRMGAEGNPLKMIQSIAGNNLEYLDASSELTAEDYLRMKTVQQEFEDMWKRIGDKLVDVYSDEKEQQIKQNVANAISEWDKKLNDRLWTSLRQSFQNAGIPLEEFDGPQTLYESLSGYIDAGIASSEGSNSDAAYQDYESFSIFWDQTVKQKWGNHLQKGDILSYDQVGEIDQKLDQWAAQARPESNMLVYLLGISVLAVVVLGGLLIREKSGSS